MRRRNPVRRRIPKSGDERAERKRIERRYEALGKVAEASEGLRCAERPFRLAALDAQDAGASLAEIA